MNRNGFTLIELLIVISIIGLVGTLSTVSFASAKEKARIAVGKATSRIVYDTIADDAVGVWSFDECSGSTVNDVSGIANHSAIFGTTNWSSDSPSGSGCSLRFNGSTYVSSGATWNVQHNNFTITAWFKTSYNGEQIMVTSGNEDILEMHTGRMHFDLAISGSSPLGTKRVNDNKWHFVIVTGDDTSMRVYLDGAKQPDLEIPPQTDVYSGEFLIGRCEAGYNFRGYLDDVRIYQRSFTAADVESHYAKEVQKFAKK